MHPPAPPAPPAPRAPPAPPLEGDPSEVKGRAPAPRAGVASRLFESPAQMVLGGTLTFQLLPLGPAPRVRWPPAKPGGLSPGRPTGGAGRGMHTSLWW